MVLALQAYTTPANTIVISDTAALAGTLPTPAISTSPAINSPSIDGSDTYIWSPNTASSQTVVFRSTFEIGNMPILALALPVSACFAFTGNDIASVSASLEVVNLLGVIVATIPLFTETNLGNPQNVAIAAGDALLVVDLLGNAGRIVVETTVTSPSVVAYSTNPGRYLGQLTVNTLAVI
ncbi:hypothetical protein [Psychrobacillus sp. NPDC096389]|uniref:hypothetical protein n=1 Tax=Psychrobacillus sp. NPDC096389 TaxID=3364490 RepID=UPI0037F4D19D